MSASDPTPRTSAPLNLPAGISRMLDRMRSRQTGLKMAEFPVITLGVVAPLWVIQAVVDRFVDLPVSVRGILLGINALVVLVLLYTLLIRPLAQKLSRRQAALLVERELPQFRSSLISAVDLTSPGATVVPESQPLVSQLLAQVEQETAKTDIPTTLLSAGRIKKLAIVTGIILVSVLTLFIVHLPVSGLLVQRILLATTPLPADTTVVSISQDLELDPGMDAVLSARAEGVVPARGQLVVTYPNGQRDTVEVLGSQADPAVFTHTVRNARGSFRYHFELNDGVGTQHRVVVVIPPSLKDIRFTQVYPSYTGLQEAVLPPSGIRLLQGSKLRIQANSSVPLASANLIIEGDSGTTVAIPLGGKDKNELSTELTVPDARSWKSLTFRLTSLDDIPSVNDPVYRVEIISDQAPLVAMLQPKKERFTMLSREKLPLSFRASDDFGLAKLTLQYRVYRPGLSELSDAAEAGSIPVEIPLGEKSLTQSAEFDLGRLVPPLVPGCRVTLWVEAEDNNTATGPGLSRSIEKYITIVTEEQKRLELIEMLGERARAIEKLYDMQREANDRTDRAVR